MNRPLLLKTSIAAALVMLFASAPSAAIEVDCSVKGVPDSLPKPPEGCHKELITSSGRAGFGEASAKRRAEDAWQGEVRNKYGERFMVWSNAACRKTECVPSSVGMLGKLMERCTYSGYPCSPQARVESHWPSIETEEIQKLLKACKYEVAVDGKIGAETRRAIKEFQAMHGLEADGLPGDKTIAALKSHCKR